MATVNLQAVSKVRANLSILHAVDLSIEKGEFVVVVGPSGCGKSTLLRLVAGLETVSSGNILINNQCVNKIPPAQRDMAMVFQNYALYPHMTVFNNIAYGLKMRGVKKSLIRERVEEVASRLQLTDFLQRKPGSLSGGECQRVAMGRAIVRAPAVFLFDEPLSNLDANLRTVMRHEIRTLQRHLNTTCLYVTHDQTEAMTMADRVVVLNQGKVEQIGTPQEIYHDPATVFVARFMGHYPINCIPGILYPHDRQIETCLGKMNIPLRFPESLPSRVPVLMGVRPEHIQLSNQPKDQGIVAQVEFIDDTGTDKLVRVSTAIGNLSIAVRVFADTEVTQQVYLDFMQNKVTVFNQETGIRLGERDEKHEKSATYDR